MESFILISPINVSGITGGNTAAGSRFLQNREQVLFIFVVSARLDWWICFLTDRRKRVNWGPRLEAEAVLWSVSRCKANWPLWGWTCELGLVSASTKNSWVSLSGAMNLFSYADSHSVLQMAMLVCQLSKRLKLGPRKAWNWGEEDAWGTELGVEGLLKTRRHTVRFAVGMKLRGSLIHWVSDTRFRKVLMNQWTKNKYH